MRALILSMAVGLGLSAGAVVPLATGSAQAGTIERACIQAGRAPSRSLCGCIQNVADITLSRSDQRKAAKFFVDPQRAQDVRMSDRRSDEKFWDRYQEFGNAARAYCASS
ncbi:hypothetical protein [Tropicimonas sp. S265A]|uniref:hypothetical protein n=1 Tax=Tropicimonas sp. S265A TaxID=3415134 RepID=UPI003C7B9EB4